MQIKSRSMFYMNIKNSVFITVGLISQNYTLDYLFVFSAIDTNYEMNNESYSK